MNERRGASVVATERRLRDAFTAAAETVDPGVIPGPPWPAVYPGRDRARRPPPRAPWPRSGPPRAGRPRRAWLREQVLVPLAAAVAVTVIAVTMTAMVPRFLASHRPSGPGPAAAGGVGGVRHYDRALGGAAPRYIVGVRQPHLGVTAATDLAVYSAITGRTVARLKPPGRGRWFQAVATFGSDRTFVAAAIPEPGAKVCSTWFYRFSLGSDGRPVNLAQLSRWTVPGVVTGDSALAASANGKLVAYATQECATPVPAVRLGVIHVASGKGATWTTRSTPRNLSLSADGALLSFVASTATGPATDPRADAAWVVRTSAPSGPLADRYRKVLHAPGGVPAAALSPSGALLFAIIGRAPPDRATVAAYLTSTGRLVIRERRVLTAQNVFRAGLSVSASGRFALVYVLRPGSVLELNLATWQLRTIPVAVADSPLGAAW